MATESLSPEYPVSYRVSCGMPHVRFAWRYRISPPHRRKHGMWQVRDCLNDAVADVYTGEADARLIAAAPRLARALKMLVLAEHPDHPAREAAIAQAQAILHELA